MGGSHGAWQDGHRPHWGDRRPGPLGRVVARLRAALGAAPTIPRHALPVLPLALRRGPLAAPYLGAERDGDHRRAGAVAARAMEAAIAERAWWPADVWGHRALWHFERSEQTLQAARTARRIGDLWTAGGDPAAARRYYAEAISEARDIGAEREEGLAAVGLGRATLELGDVTMARRLAAIGLDLLERCGAPASELAAARALRGVEKPVGASRTVEPE